jgi:hypothetical protein
MNRILAFSLFFCVFFVIYFGMHLYVFTRIAQIFIIDKDWVFYLVMALFALSFPIMSIIERAINGIVSKVFYTASAVWLGALFLLLCSMLIYDLINLISRFAKFDASMTLLIGKVLVVLAIIITIYGVINAMFVNVKEITVPIKNLDNELRIVQLSDVHLGTIHNKGYLADIVEKTNNLNPDMVLITGDLFDGGSMLKDDFILPLNDLRAKSFFSMGNHEIYEGIEEVTRILNETNVSILRNEVKRYKGMQIIGIDNPPNEFGGKNEIISSMKFNKSIPSILMYHPPLSLEESQAAGVSLQLSGHTHNGQIFPFTLLSMLVYPKVHGLYEYLGTYMYVSSGTGTWGPPLRVGSNSEITVINLVRS